MRTIIRNKRGAALVEFAIVVLLLFTLLFGIIEFALIMKDYLSLNQAAREGARSAALFSNQTVVLQRVTDSAPGISDPEHITPDVWYRTYSGGAWGAWTSGVPAGNNPASDIQVKVEATYPHKTITGRLFGLSNTITLTGKMVFRLEKGSS